MPVLGADMEVGTIVEWRVTPGDVVHRGDIVAVVDTDKSTIEVEVFEDATVEEILVPPGVEVPVGTPLARLRADANVPALPTADEPHDGSFVRASPLARRLAVECGVDLADVAGCGPEGAVLASDLPPADVVQATPPAVPVLLTDRHADLRRAVGVLMARSAREIPHYYLATTIDLQAAMEWLRAMNDDRPPADRVLPAALLLRAVARSAADVEVVNGTWVEDRFVPGDGVHLGVAVALRGGGLIAPAIQNADRLGVVDLMVALRELVQRARSGVLRSSDAEPATITVTNLGDQGVDEVYGVIHAPQVALVGFGTIADRPWAAGGMLGVRPVVRATLAADHRASDGREGARCLSRIDQLLQTPEEL